MKIFLSITAILAWIFGAMHLIIPKEFYAAGGMELTPMLATIAQAHGATMFGLGVINWIARNVERKGLIAVLTGNLVVQVLSLFVVLRTMSLGAGTSAVPGIVIHVVLGSLYVFFLLKARKM